MGREAGGGAGLQRTDPRHQQPHQVGQAVTVIQAMSIGQIKSPGSLAGNGGDPTHPNRGPHTTNFTPAPFLTRGACATQGDPDWWHPTSRTVPTIRNAIAICDGCPVKFQCGQWALENRIADGIYGGMDEWQRGQIMRRST